MRFSSLAILVFLLVLPCAVADFSTTYDRPVLQHIDATTTVGCQALSDLVVDVRQVRSLSHVIAWELGIVCGGVLLWAVRWGASGYLPFSGSHEE